MSNSSTTSLNIFNNVIVKDSVELKTLYVSGSANVGNFKVDGLATVATAAAGTNTTQVASTGFVCGEINALINGATGGAYDTLRELGDLLASDTSGSGGLVTSIALKAPLASPTFTGTVSGVTATMVGLGLVDNTSDLAKPVSTAEQAALNLKANIVSPVFTGALSAADGNMTIDVSGNIVAKGALSVANAKMVIDVSGNVVNKGTISQTNNVSITGTYAHTSVNGATAAANSRTNLILGNGGSTFYGSFRNGDNTNLIKTTTNQISFDVGVQGSLNMAPIVAGDPSSFGRSLTLQLGHNGVSRNGTMLLDWNAQAMDRTECAYPAAFCKNWVVKIYNGNNNHKSIMGNTKNLGYSFKQLSFKNEQKRFGGTMDVPDSGFTITKKNSTNERVNVISDTEIIYYFTSGNNAVYDCCPTDSHYMRLKVQPDGSLAGFTNYSYSEFNTKMDGVMSYVKATERVTLWEGKINDSGNNDISNGSIINYGTPQTYTGTKDTSGYLIVDTVLDGPSDFTWAEYSYSANGKSGIPYIDAIGTSGFSTLSDYVNNVYNFWTVNDLNEICPTKSPGWERTKWMLALKKPTFNYKLSLNIRVVSGKQMSFNKVKNGMVSVSGVEGTYLNGGLFQRGRYEMQLINFDHNVYGIPSLGPMFPYFSADIQPEYSFGPLVPDSSGLTQVTLTQFPYNTVGDVRGSIVNDVNGNIIYPVTYDGDAGCSTNGHVDSSGNPVNFYELWVVGRMYTLHLNGVIIYQNQRVDGPTGGSCDIEEANAGLIWLQNEVATNPEKHPEQGFFYSNIQVTPITNEEFMLNASNTLVG